MEYMNTATHNPHDRTHERTMLLQTEESRSEQSGRDFYWDAQRWINRLAALINCERASDAVYQQQIHEFVIGSEAQVTLEQRIDATLKDDIAWYQRLLNLLRTLRTQWETRGRTDTPHYNELFSHECQIELRLIERQMRQKQLWMENLERRRRLNGALEQGMWAQYWNDLHSVFDNQAQFYTNTYQLELPTQYLDERLDWLTNLREFQRATKQIWSDDRRFDSDGYRADARALKRAIAKLTPVAAGGSGDGGGILAIALCVIVIVVIFMLFTGGSKNTPPTLETPHDRSVEINNQGKALIKAGRCNEAIPIFEQAAAADPSFYEPLNNIAFCLYDQGQVEQAIARWRDALTLNQESPDTNAGLGMALYTQGNIDEGRRYYQKAISININYRDPAWLKRERLWSDRAIANSAALRDTNAP
jgi:tetratricopeptide (TPR) repeat protein